jgi:hypothetical protein
MLQYGCGHLATKDINRCGESFRRENQRVCTPQEAWIQEGIDAQLNPADANNQRFLPRDLDVQDRNAGPLCPVCEGTTPPSSRGSDQS